MQIEIKASAIKPHIGKQARILKKNHFAPIDYRHGTIKDLQGKNVQIGGDWFYFADLKSIEILFDPVTIPL